MPACSRWAPAATDGDAVAGGGDGGVDSHGGVAEGCDALLGRGGASSLARWEAPREVAGFCVQIGGSAVADAADSGCATGSEECAVGAGTAGGMASDRAASCGQLISLADAESS